MSALIGDDNRERLLIIRAVDCSGDPPFESSDPTGVTPYPHSVFHSRPGLSCVFVATLLSVNQWLKGTVSIIQTKQ